MKIYLHKHLTNEYLNTPDLRYDYYIVLSYIVAY